MAARVGLLTERGPPLPYPYSSDINGSRHGVMRELRAQAGGNPLRVFYAFDPRRTAILLIGGDKTGKDRFYEEYVPVADNLYDEHLEELRRKGLILSGRHPFSELTKDFTPERRQRVTEMKRELLAEMPLHELRRARSLTQRDMAKILKVNQPAVSKLEQRADVYVSSLRSYIEAVGGNLKIIAAFPEGEVTITNFSELEGMNPQAELESAPAETHNAT